MSDSQTEIGVYKGVRQPDPSDPTYAEIVLEVL